MAFVRNALLVLFFPFSLTLGPPLFGISVNLLLLKTFDRVWNKALISRHHSFRISPSLCELLPATLSSLSKAANVGGHRSAFKSIIVVFLKDLSYPENFFYFSLM